MPRVENEMLASDGGKCSIHVQMRRGLSVSSYDSLRLPVRRESAYGGAGPDDDEGRPVGFRSLPCSRAFAGESGREGGAVPGAVPLSPATSSKTSCPPKVAPASMNLYGRSPAPSVLCTPASAVVKVLVESGGG